MDDHHIVRDGLRELLNNQEDMDMVGDARDADEALEKVRLLRPDVILIDIAMPGMSGLALMGLIKEISPETKIVILSMYKKEAFVQQALRAGALGYVLKTSPSYEIFEAIRAARDGNYFLSANIAGIVIEKIFNQETDKPMATGYELLNDREQTVFRMMVEGMTTKDMADIFCLSPKTIEKYRSAVMSKVGIHNILDLIKYAVKIGIIDPELWED